MPPTPIHVPRLAAYLEGYHSELSARLLSGFSAGFPLGFCGRRQSVFFPNHNSLALDPSFVDRQLQTELAAGRKAGPFSCPPFPCFRCSPLGLVPKKTPGEYRIIHDLSAGGDFSVNAGIPQDARIVHYSSIDDAIRLLCLYGSGSLMACLDIAHAYKLVPVSPADYELLGFSWRGLYYYDMTLPFGCASSCQIFELFSSAFHWILEQKLATNPCVHLLDDFFFVGPPHSPACSHDVRSFRSLASDLGVPIKETKCRGPSTQLVLFGLELDSLRMEASLPVDKLHKLRCSIASAARKRRITLRDLQSLIGFLNFACSVVVPGRAFLRRLINLTCKVSRPYHRIRLTREARSDITVWHTFTQYFNGKSLFLPITWTNSDTIRLYSDASNMGFACVFGQPWFCGSWPAQMQDFHITFKELFPIVLAVEIWGVALANSKVLFSTDNQAVAHILNRTSSKDSLLMKLVRRLVVTCLTHNILFKAVHIPGSTNVIADLLSRFQLPAARRHAPWLAPQPVQIPSSLLQGF